MKFRNSMMIATLLCATGAFAQDKTSAEYPVHTLDEVIALAAQHKAGAEVTVDFPIAGVDFRGDHVFLDSMKNYRDPHSVNVNVFPHSARLLHLTPDAGLVGKTLTVHGIAMLVPIKCLGDTVCPQDAQGDDYQSPVARNTAHFIRGQHPKADYYFQTQIFVREPDDAQINNLAAK